MIIMNTYNVIDLFSGAGGLSLGFKQAGYNILCGLDNNEHALKTYSHNFKESKAIKVDLFKEKKTIEKIEKIIENKKVDVIIAGPPCQGFSLTGARNLEDNRNKLYLAVVHAVKHFKPQAFMIENVPGIMNLYQGKVKEQIVNSFEDIGYDVSFTKKPLLAADYGVPQFRKRMFFVGFKKDLNYPSFEFPKPYLKCRNYVTCSKAISDLPTLENELGEDESNYTKNPKSNYQKAMRKNSKKLYNHVASCHSEKVKWVIDQVPEGGNYKDLPEGVGDFRKFHEAWTRYHSKKPSKTIDTGHGNHFHYKYNRVPTVRENARLQSFPDNFRFLGVKTQQYRQVGNAVPPLLAQAIGEEMLKYLNR